MEHNDWKNGANDKLKKLANKYGYVAVSFGYSITHEEYCVMIRNDNYDFEHANGATIGEAIGELDRNLNKKLNTKRGRIEKLRQQLAELEA